MGKKVCDKVLILFPHMPFCSVLIHHVSHKVMYHREKDPLHLVTVHIVVNVHDEGLIFT